MGGLSCFSEWTQYNHRGQSLREKRFGTEAEVRDKGRWSAAVLRMRKGLQAKEYRWLQELERQGNGFFPRSYRRK